MDDDVRKLIEFLAEDCGWPLEEEQIDRSAWPVNNAELGLNDEVAVDSVEIYELRPLTTHQPWGVFFVAVKGTSNLSMSLLRKLLRGLVKKKRASADTSNLQQWDLEDLMFVCSLDEPENTTRYFAHFKEQEKGLPKLMIGARWQDSQPESEIKAAKLKLKSNLKWPDHEEDIGSWRDQWGKAFPIGHKEVIKTSSNLASALAKYAVIIKQNIPDIYSIESDNGPVHRLFEAFKEALISDLKTDDFADMVAQTITYGLFSARATGSELTGIETLSECIPATNPFLKALFMELSALSGTEPTDLDFDDLEIDKLISMLNQANIESVMSDFGSQFKGGKEDPVIHFYETFLTNYDNELRAERGVFYTPKSVVDFIVRSVHERLIVDHNLPLGLADTTTHIIDGKEWPKVMILDPATGTGTFLQAAIEIIHETMLSHWKQEGKGKSEIHILWNEYVDKDLLPRLYGFELMMAPYSIAHLKLGLKLQQTGYDIENGGRLNVFMTNTLEETNQLSKWIPEYLAIEAKEAGKVKEQVPITVVIGNPPYSGESANENQWIRNLLRNPISSHDDGYFRYSGEPLGEKNPKWLNDDYVKFIRHAQNVIVQTGEGVLGFVTNHGFIDNPTFRGMRESLTSTFDKISILDLNGNAKKAGLIEGIDQNVFDIQQGVCVSIMSKNIDSESSVVETTGLTGSRISKYEFLRNKTMNGLEAAIIHPSIPHHLFLDLDVETASEYERGISITNLFYENSVGIATARDALTVKFTEEEVLSTVTRFSSISAEDARVEFSLGKDVRDWKVHLAQQDIKNTNCDPKRISRLLYRPMDYRYTYFTGKTRGFHCMPRPGIMKHMIDGENFGLITSRLTKGERFAHIQFTNTISEVICMSPRTSNNGFLFPLYRKVGEEYQLNLKKAIVSSVSEFVGIETLDGQDVFHYIAAILHSEYYRRIYEEQLRIDFPKIQFTNNSQLFRKLVELGNDIVALHLLNTDYERASWNIDSKAADPFSKMKFDFIERDNGRVVGKITKGKALVEGDVLISPNLGDRSSRFTNVNASIWEHMIGGYQVCEKWLYDRRERARQDGRVLTNDDVIHYRKMLTAIELIIGLTNQIDEVIEEQGGWPLEGSDEFEVPDERDEGQTGLFDF